MKDRDWRGNLLSQCCDSGNDMLQYHNKDVEDKLDFDSYGMFVSIMRGSYPTTVWLPINYCPFCGKKLE